MTLGERLFQKILDEPDSDANRLVFADWLEEQGGTDRAEFIRVQIELTRFRMPAKCSNVLHPDDCDYCQAQEKITELRRREQQSFRGMTPYLVCGEGIREFEIAISPTSYHRGFVEWVHIPWTAWEWHHEEIRKATPLRKVKLTDEMPLSESDNLIYETSGPHMRESRVLKHKKYPGIVFEFAPLPIQYQNLRPYRQADYDPLGGVTIEAIETMVGRIGDRVSISWTRLDDGSDNGILINQRLDSCFPIDRIEEDRTPRLEVTTLRSSEPRRYIPGRVGAIVWLFGYTLKIYLNDFYIRRMLVGDFQHERSVREVRTAGSSGSNIQVR